MPFRTYYLDPAGALHTDLDDAATAAAFASQQGMLWIDIMETSAEDGKFLEEVCHFHPLSVEDCISPLIHSPKIDDFENYLFMVVHGINHTMKADVDVVETAELNLFLGNHFVVSNHNFSLYSVEAVRQMVERDRNFMKRGADFLAYALIDALVDNVLPTIDKMSEDADKIEEEAIRQPRKSTLEAIMKLKRSTQRIHRVMAPQREIMNRFSRGEFHLIRKDQRIYYRDIFDHLIRIEDLNQMLRDRADNSLSTYLSAVANGQNEVMKVLSVVATIFLPLTLLAGIYGMNFEYMPELHWRWGYFAVLGFMATAILAAVFFFWARRWFTWGRRRAVKFRPFEIKPEKLRGYIGHLTRLKR
ncbi:MAG: magnesium/cobalt transporter CorA [Chloroflexota bacterium]